MQLKRKNKLHEPLAPQSAPLPAAQSVEPAHPRGSSPPVGFRAFNKESSWCRMSLISSSKQPQFWGNIQSQYKPVLSIFVLHVLAEGWVCPMTLKTTWKDFLQFCVESSHLRLEGSQMHWKLPRLNHFVHNLHLQSESKNTHSVTSSLNKIAYVSSLTK